MSPTKDTHKGLSDEEKAAMKDRMQELKAGKTNTVEAVLAKIAEMPEPDQTMAKRLHTIITTNAPDLSPKLWYGMPAYAKAGKVVVFFQNPARWDSRYMTVSFNDTAKLDDGAMWPVSFALMKLTAAEEARISALVKKAVS